MPRDVARSRSGDLCRLLGFVAASVVGGCAPTIAQSDPRVTIAPERLAALPPIVDVFWVDYDLAISHDEEKARLATSNIEASFNESLSGAGVRLFEEPAVAGIAGYDEFMKWTRRAITDVYDDVAGQDSAQPGHPGVYAWRYPGSLDALRASLRADFVLVSQFLEGDGPKDLAYRRRLAEGKAKGPRRQATACVVDLRSGQLIWCDVDQVPIFLHERRLAGESVKRLLKHLVLVPGAASPTASTGVSTAPAQARAPAAAPTPPVRQAADSDEP
jgi:hypothetical protein